MWVSDVSASEKLKALDAEWRSDEPFEWTRQEAVELALVEALPQIVAVVQAAEQARRYVTDARDSLDEDEMEDGEPSVTAARLMAAEIVLAPPLADLDEALT